MKAELRFGIQTNGIKHTEADPMPDIDTRFRMVKESGVFDYVDKTPAPDEIDQFLTASEKYGLPVRAGGWFYTLDRDEDLLRSNLELGKRLGSLVHNVQIKSYKEDGSLVSDEEVIRAYLQAYEIGERLGVTPCFEVHVNMWSEDFRRVEKVGEAVEARGVPFNMTLDHSHVIFKMDNPEELAVFDLTPAVESGDLVLDPFKPGNVSERWIEAGWVRHCHARAAIPNNPKNVTGRDEQGNPGRGIQYPFKQPGPGEYHAEWREEALEPWKEVIRRLLHYHAAHGDSRLGQISTEFIPGPDYGQGCKYSIFDHSVACAQWMRETWESIEDGSATA